MNILLITILVILFGIFLMNIIMLMVNMMDYIIEDDERINTRTHTDRRTGVFDVFDPGCFFD